MTLNQPYYIEQRKNSMDLNGQWEFFYADDVMENINDDMWKYKTTLPKSSYYSLYEAGILPHPYVGTNSKLYDFPDKKVWYYRKKFFLDKKDFDGNAFLCFEGVSYYCRIFVNGTLLGDHEGMFGGPVIDVKDKLNLSGENEIVVEVKAANYGVEKFYNYSKPQIIPWNIIRDYKTSNGDFVVMGIWNKVRLEFVEKLHLSRPYLYTKSIEKNSAELFLEFEIADGDVPELKPFCGYNDNNYYYTRAFDNGVTGAKKDKKVEIRINISEPDTKKCVYKSSDEVSLNNYEKSLIDERFYELQFFSKSIKIDNPKLWYPNGLGEPYLYNVNIEMYCEDVLCDAHEFKTGIRKFEAKRTAGEKYRARWEDFSFKVNGKEFFLMGMNWMPIDFLFDIDESEYKWCLTLAKNAGIQLLRVWNGGGMYETDTFYKLCDELGIMVWQDALIANDRDSDKFPQDILESQIAYNIYRIRNHPSLVINCGGNEFNPYNTLHAASMFVQTRVYKDLMWDRIFHYTTADRGSAHIYRDMEPVWYRHAYKQLPFLGESGIHSFPSFKTLTQLLNEKELKGTLPEPTSKEFQENYPELLNHFTEYIPERVPRMLSRCSQIADLKEITLEEMCEASHVQAYEYYTIMIQSMRENYPVCGGIMPWVFKRPWATAGIQTVDGGGQPTYPYYAVKNAYNPLNVCLCLEWSVIAPNEPVALKTKIFNQNNEDLTDAVVKIAVFNPDMTVAEEKGKKAENYIDFGEFVPNENFTDKCFLICVSLEKEDKVLSETSYFIKCTSELCDKELYEKYRSEASENLYFNRGPWLKESVQKAKKANVSASIIKTGKDGNFRYADILIENNSHIAAYPVTVETKNLSIRFFLSDNFFMLKAGESKIVRAVWDKDTDASFTVNGWNFEKTEVGL